MLIGEQLFRLIRPIDVHRNWYSSGRWYTRRTKYNKRRRRRRLRRLSSSNSLYCCVRSAKEAMIREIRQGSHQNDQVIHFQSDKTYEVGPKSTNLPKRIHGCAEAKSFGLLSLSRLGLVDADTMFHLDIVRGALP
jgi:hypothetical protein